MAEDGLGSDAEKQQLKKQQLEYEEAMKLLELLMFDSFNCSLPGTKIRRLEKSGVVGGTPS